MVNIKENLKVGSVGGLTSSEVIILRHLLTIKHHGQANWLIHKETGLSESTITKAVRELQDRGILYRKRGYATLQPNVVERLIKDITD